MHSYYICYCLLNQCFRPKTFGDCWDASPTLVLRACNSVAVTFVTWQLKKAAVGTKNLKILVLFLAWKSFLCLSGSASQDSQLYCQSGLEARPPPPSLHQHYYSRSQIDIDPGESLREAQTVAMDITNRGPMAAEAPSSAVSSSKIGHTEYISLWSNPVLNSQFPVFPPPFQFFH